MGIAPLLLKGQLAVQEFFGVKVWSCLPGGLGSCDAGGGRGVFGYNPGPDPF